MDVSIIVPAYNSEKTIAGTIESILIATKIPVECEIVVVDDGSTDETGEICDKYANEYNGINVIHTENKGVSHARNTGIRKAKGKYILFVDSDDKIKYNMITTMYKVAEKGQFDLVCCGYIREELQSRKEFVPYSKEYNKEELIGYLAILEIQNSTLCGSPWAKLFKRDCVMEFNIQFPENMSFGEDFCFFSDYCQRIQNAIFINEAFYVYNVHRGSLYSRYQRNMMEMNTKLYLKKRVLFEDYIETIKWINTQYIENTLSQFALIENRDLEKPVKKRIQEELYNSKILRDVIDSGNYQNRSFIMKLNTFFYKHRMKGLLHLVMKLKAWKYK